MTYKKVWNVLRVHTDNGIKVRVAYFLEGSLLARFDDKEDAIIKAKELSKELNLEVMDENKDTSIERI